VRFENIEGIWIPLEFDARSVWERLDSTFTANIHKEIVHIDIDPNHAELQSFVLDVENGTRVRILEVPGIRYTWQDGKIVTDINECVIDEIDRITEEIMAEGQVSTGLKAAKKIGAATADKQADTVEAQSDVLSESRPFPVLVLIPIGLLIIAFIAWRVFLLRHN